jgi:uncharacterized membrane protein required for colicin V production
MFDLMLFLVIIVSMFMGFSQGVIRQVLNLGAIFFGLLVAATYQPRVARWFEMLVGPTNDFVRNTMMFILVVLVVWILFNVAVYFAFKETKLQTGQTLDRLLGLVLGLASGFVWCAILLMIIGFMTRTAWPEEYDGLRQMFATGLESSILRPTFLSIIPPLANAIKSLVPNGALPPIFIQYDAG